MRHHAWHCTPRSLTPRFPLVHRKTLLDARRTVLISNREKEKETYEQRKAAGPAAAEH